MVEDLLPSVEINPPNAITASVIWLHGLGADGHDFEAIVPELALPPELGIRFVFPHAPYRPVTLNGGYVMRAWFDIDSLDFAQQPDFAGINVSEKAIQALIQREIDDGIDPQRIILAGFSQGGSIALHTALRYPLGMGGILALSTFFPSPRDSQWTLHPANARTPIFMAHGTHDEVVQFRYGKASKNNLEKLACNVHWHTYTMGHSVCLEEVRHIADWLREVLAPRTATHALDSFCS